MISFLYQLIGYWKKRLCCRFNAEIKDNPGLGCDWKTWWQKGLTPSLKEIYINILKDTPNHFVAACAIYLDFSGISSNQLRIFINQLYKSGIGNKTGQGFGMIDIV